MHFLHICLTHLFYYVDVDVDVDVDVAKKKGVLRWAYYVGRTTWGALRGACYVGRATCIFCIFVLRICFII